MSIRRRTHERRWKTKEFDKEVFIEAFRANSGANLNADELTEAVATACDASMPRKLEPRNQRRPAYWWNELLGALRAACLRARRRVQRSRSEAEREERRIVFREARAAFKQEVKRSKSSCYKELCREADENPWGNAYRVVMARLKGPATPVERCPDMLKRIVDGLFPQHDPTLWPPTPYEDDEDPGGIRISNEELLAVAKSLKVKKAPGPDGIPNVALKTAILVFPELFRTTLQKCLEEGCFPDRWKVQKLVLLPKPGKPSGDPSSYRPICLLDTLGKLLERVILNRLTECTEGERGLSERQFGFRKGLSTVDAIRTVVCSAEKASKQKRRGNRFCAVVTIDVKNAFNSASWEAIAVALHRMRVPGYLCGILKSYFQNRVLVYETELGQKSIQITAGVPQGSILGPTLWNAMYDGVLSLDLPDGVEIVGFADDVVLTITGETLEEVEMLTAEAMDTIEAWMTRAKLRLAHHKTEVALVSNCRAVQRMEINLGGCSISSKRALKHLGVMVDDRLNFNAHVDYACEKASKAINTVARIMPNVGGPRSSNRRLLANVAVSILRYGAPAWHAAVRTKRNRRMLNSTFRLMAIRVASAYRTISSAAVCVIAGMMPICITLAEDVECYQRRDTRNVRRIVRADSLAKWQQEWDNAENGRWTYRLIPNVSAWVNRKHGEVNFHLTQFLSGHGCFRKYLHRFGHASSPFCPECANVEETPEHVIFECPRFEEERIGIRGVTVDNVIHEMCRVEDTWNAVDRAVTRILSELQRKWRRDQRSAG